MLVRHEEVLGGWGHLNVSGLNQVGEATGGLFACGVGLGAVRPMPVLRGRSHDVIRAVREGWAALRLSG